jgi:predicted porin
MRRSLITSLIVVVCLVVLGLSSFAEEPATPADKSAKPHSSSSAGATKEEVDQLRGALASQQATMASQQKTIEELKTMVSALAQRLGTGDARVLPAAATQGAHVQTLGYSSSTDPLAALASMGQAAQANLATQKAPEKKAPDKFEFSFSGTKVQIYGHSDVSYDYVDNGISSAMEATNPFLGPAAVARANNGWLGQVSSNLSYFGVRGSHKINDYLTGVFQFETEVMMSDTPGPTSDLQCKYCLGSRDTYVGISGPWGAIKVGKEDAPYKKTTTGAFDPFINTIGDQRSIIGNSGGDNRAEFMGRVSHAIWYESPTHKGLYASILFSPGQNRSSDNSSYPRGEPNCAGGNGAFTLSFQNSPNVAEGADLYSVVPPDLNPCNDGSFGNVVSTAVTYRGYGVYAFGGYEHHSQVNRTTDLVGVADEAAWKFGLEYTFKKTGTTPSFVYEKLKRYNTTTVSIADGQPSLDPRLDERSRPTATWLALRQKLTNKDTFNFSWIYAGNSRGDPGFCAPEAPGNCAPGQNPATAPFNVVNNASNMYAAGLKHTLSRNMSTYFVYARQANHADAHYDLGAVGHGLIVDKRDFTHAAFPGTRLQGLSAGLTFDF